MEYQEITERQQAEQKAHAHPYPLTLSLPQPASSTMSNLAFLLLSFPLGLLYFLVVVIGFSLGVGTLVIWIGLPILFITLYAARGMGEVERRLVSTVLHMPMLPHLPSMSQPHQGFLRHFGHLLSDPYTWTSIVYMIIKFPLGIFNFTIALTFSTLSLALTLLPLNYMISLLVCSILLKNGHPSTNYIIPGFIEVHGTFDLVMFARSFIGVPVGIITWLVSRYLFSGLALISGELARALLSPGATFVNVQPHTMSYASPGFSGTTNYSSPSFPEERQRYSE